MADIGTLAGGWARGVGALGTSAAFIKTVLYIPIMLSCYKSVFIY